MDNYTKEVQINKSAEEVYAALTTQDGLMHWLTTQTVIYPQVGGIATFHFGKDTYFVMKITKLLSAREIVWKCVEQYLKVSGSDKTDEWVGTSLKITLTNNKDNSTTLILTHNGLNDELSCYKKSTKDWNFYLDSLKEYLETGKGKPFGIAD